MSRTTITGKGQITIPASIREQYDLQNGDMLEFLEGSNAREIRLKVVRRHSAEELLGLLASDQPYLGSLEAERKIAAQSRLKPAVASAASRVRKPKR